MPPSARHSFQVVLLPAVLALLWVTATARPAFLKASSVHSTAAASDANGQCVRRVVQSVHLAGQFEIPSGTTFRNTIVGGLSAMTYDHDRDVYYLLSDDREDSLHRFYTATIDVVAHTVNITNVTFLTRSSGVLFAGSDLDPEGVVYSDDGTLFVSSERDPPALMEFGLDGQLIRYLNIPDYYMPNSDGTFGTRSNLGFEGLSLSPNGRHLWAANEGALAQDGPRSSLNGTSPCRFISFNVRTGQPVDELIYVSDKIVRPPMPATGFADNGVTEIIVLNDKSRGGSVHFLVLERSFSIGTTLPDRGYSVRMYEASTQNARQFAGDDTARNPEYKSMHKRLLGTVEGFGVYPDNLEGLQLVKTGCGKATLIVMSDDNFSAFGPQSSQFLFFDIIGDF